MRYPTLHDVARAAGVSYSTADRVLNRRGGVAEKSVQRVHDAIQELGYRRDMTAANLSRRRIYRFRVYIPQGDHGFFGNLRAALRAQAAARAGERMRIDLHDVVPDSPRDLADQLERLSAEDLDCTALVGAKPEDLAEAIDRLAGRGIPVLTLVSDVPGQRRAYVGIDNLVAGRTAGRLLRIGRGGRDGPVLPVLGSHALRDHRDRLAGAAEVLGAEQLLPAIEVRDQPDRMRDRLRQALSDTPAIAGVYSIGAGNRGLIPLMRELGAVRPFVVLHELTPHSRAALQAELIDAVIDQKPAEEIAVALDAMKAIADGQTPRVDLITPAIFFKENLPGGEA